MSNSTTSSPFRISKEAEEELERNEAFRSVRQHLRRKERETDMLNFCPFHQHACSPDEKETFRLHRDITHALLLPLFEIHNQATQIAKRALSRKRGAEPERAFRGEARGAFTWLHSILTEERDFCLAEGCPACVVLHVLYSEPTIRLVAVACLLCDFLPETELPEIKNRFPTFEFWLRALERSVRDDPLWGDAFWPEIEYRAYGLNVDIRQLIMQCLELRSAPEAQEPPSKPLCAISTRPSRQVYRVHVRSIPVQPSPFARRQLKMMWEEQELMSKYLMTCWASMCWNERRLKMLEYRSQSLQERSITS
ncbi:hypothetical protein VTN77DRAFT_227 [Rasamsonia byssochlamydoides]|uniref:uncharacterized protein n=1 Tax=Rasamsonia byssochlamydoides TaxID=89139 RepID=UPI003742C40B